MNSIICQLIRHSLDGFSFRDDLSIEEKSRLMQGRMPSPIVELSWMVEQNNFSLRIPVVDAKPMLSVSKLPDSTGFICFESKRHTDNCLLLDAYGKERIRLSVPIALMNKEVPHGATMWFRNISGPYVNPSTGEEGKFGVTAWIEYAGDYYFELDWGTGEFLWGKEIRF